MKPNFANSLRRLAGAALILAALAWAGPAWGGNLWDPSEPRSDDLWITSDLDHTGPPLTAKLWVWIRDNAKVKLTNSGISAETIAVGGLYVHQPGGQLTASKSVLSANDFRINHSNLTADNSTLSASGAWWISDSNITAKNKSVLSSSGYHFVLDDNSNMILTDSKLKLTSDYSLLIYGRSQLTALEKSEITAAGIVIMYNGSQLTANDSTIDGGQSIAINGGTVQLLNGSTMKADGIYSSGQLTAEKSTITADTIFLDYGQLTATEVSNITADFVSLWEGSRLTAEKSHITADSVIMQLGSTLTLKEGSYLKTTGTQPAPDTWLPRRDWGWEDYYSDLGSDIYFKAGLAVYSYNPYNYNSLVRIAGPNVTIENQLGAAFFKGSTLEVGPYELKVIGDLTFLNGSTYSLERTDSSIGLTNVTGQASGDGKLTIYPGANLLITKGATEAINDNNKTFLTATGGVNRLGGRGFKNILYNFDYSDPKAVSLGSRRSSQSFMEEEGAGANFINAGALIDRIVKSNPDLGDKLLVTLQKIGFALESAPGQAEKALRQLIGEGALHTVNAHHNTVSQVAATLGGRLQTLLSGLPPAAGNGPADNRLWLKPFGQWNHQKDDNNVLGYHYNSGGLMLGYDREMALPGLTLGLYGSLAQGRLENDLAETSLRTAGLGLYSLYEFGQYFVDASLGCSRSDNQANIGISEILGGGNKSSEFHSGSYQAGLDFGRVFQILEKASLTPSAGIRLTQVKQKGWTEKVVSPDPENTLPANWFGDSRQNFVEIPLNLKLAATYETKGGATVSPELRLGGIIEANHPKSEFRLGFVGSNDSAIISGIAPGRSRLVAGAGLKAQLSEATDVFLNYDLEARSGYQGHSASAGIGISF